MDWLNEERYTGDLPIPLFREIQIDLLDHAVYSLVQAYLIVQIPHTGITDRMEDNFIVCNRGCQGLAQLLKFIYDLLCRSKCFEGFLQASAL